MAVARQGMILVCNSSVQLLKLYENDSMMSLCRVLLGNELISFLAQIATGDFKFSDKDSGSATGTDALTWAALHRNEISSPMIIKSKAIL